MNTVNQTFNWSRFTAALRKEVVENKRALLFAILCIYGLLSMIMILGNLVAFGAGNVADALSSRIPQMVVGSIMTVVVCVAASMAFRDLRTKSGRVGLFTSPSSTLEKFLVNVLIYVVGLFVAYFACAQLADLTRIAALWLFSGKGLVVPGPINFLTSLNVMVSQADYAEVGLQRFGFMMILGLVSNAGMYLLGSVIWPRLSLLKTFAALYAIEFGVFIIALPFFALFGDVEALGAWFVKWVTEGAFTDAMVVCVCVQIVLFFGLAWYLFKRKDVISLKWWK